MSEFTQRPIVATGLRKKDSIEILIGDAAGPICHADLAFADIPAFMARLEKAIRDPFEEALKSGDLERAATLSEYLVQIAEASMKLSAETAALTEKYMRAIAAPIVGSA